MLNEGQENQKKVTTNEYYWHQEHHSVMHEGFGCLGGKNGGTPAALKCMTTLFKEYKITIEGKTIRIPPLAIVTARAEMNEY